MVFFHFTMDTKNYKNTKALVYSSIKAECPWSLPQRASVFLVENFRLRFMHTYKPRDKISGHFLHHDTKLSTAKKLGALWSFREENSLSSIFPTSKPPRHLLSTLFEFQSWTSHFFFLFPCSSFLLLHQSVSCTRAPNASLMKQGVIFRGDLFGSKCVSHERK